jgi:hypothetical protein
MVEVANQELNRADFDRVLAVLQREQDAMKLTRGQRIAYWSYAIFLWCFILCIFGLIVSSALMKEGHPTKADAVQHACIALGMISLFGGVVSLVLNLPLTVKIIRQRLAVRRMGVSGASHALWRAQRKAQPWQVILRRVLRALAILAFAIAALITLAGGGIKVGLVTLPAFGLLLLMMYVLERGKAWLNMMSAQGADARKLQESLMTLQTSEGGEGIASIAVPNAAIQAFSRIESEQIARSRVNAIARSEQSLGTEYSISPSIEVRKVKVGLEPQQRLKVEEAFDALMLDPRPSSALPDAGTGLLRQRVEGTNLEFMYSVDDAARQLKLVSLHHSAAGSVVNA